MKRSCGCLALLVMLTSPMLADDVALFINDVYVDYTPGDPESEAWNLEQTIPDLGHNLTTFSSIVAADITAATAGQDALVIPELENSGVGDAVVAGPTGSLALDLGPAGRQAIADFVSGGGNLLVFGSTVCPALELLFETFGILVEPGEDSCLEARAPRGNPVPPGAESGPWSLNDPDALGNTFEGGPAMLEYIDDTTDLLASSLPMDSLSFYVEDDGSVVAAFPFGDGYILFLGYDWSQDFVEVEEDDESPGLPPFGALEDWEDVLDRAIRFPGFGGGANVLAIPTLSPISIALLVGLLSLAAVLALRRLDSETPS